MDTLQLVLVAAAVLVFAGAGWLVLRRRETPPADSAVPAPSGLGGRLSKSSQSLGGALRSVLGRPDRDGFWDDLEEALIGADVGVAAATDIVTRVRHTRPTDGSSARTALRDAMVGELSGRDRRLMLGDTKPALVMMVGVNGAGKTTTIAKLARRLTETGSTPLLGAADTFRAAADAQLRTWGERLGVDVVGGQEGGDPASVAFDAVGAARARGADVVIIDTAGRLQSKRNLMAELSKIKRVLERGGDIVDEVLLVLDATGGQNGIAQVEEFSAAVGVTGIVLTKLDGTARGGVVVAVERSLGVPVKFVGVGEGLDDLVEFDPSGFIEALLADA